jgi:hypothetical protein
MATVNEHHGRCVHKLLVIVLGRLHPYHTAGKLLHCCSWWVLLACCCSN